MLLLASPCMGRGRRIVFDASGEGSYLTVGAARPRCVPAALIQVSADSSRRVAIRRADGDAVAAQYARVLAACRVALAAADDDVRPLNSILRARVDADKGAKRQRMIVLYRGQRRLESCDLPL